MTNQCVFRAGASATRLLLMGALALGLMACSDNDDTSPQTNRLYRVTVVNLTAGQPFSPPAVIAHNGGYSPFTLGMAASLALETLAEGGDNSLLLSEASTVAAVKASDSAAAVLLPGATTTLTLQVPESQLEGLRLSSIAMLVNTNDGFVAATSLGLDELALGESVSVNANSYDSGTEANSESAGTIPGPADGGEGYNPARDDSTDLVLQHPGVITFEGGLSGSRLTELQRWDNPVARVTVTRLE